MHYFEKVILNPPPQLFSVYGPLGLKIASALSGVAESAFRPEHEIFNYCSPLVQTRVFFHRLPASHQEPSNPIWCNYLISASQ